jgi:DNA-binding XRE family transcriptional regulator
MTRSEIGKAVGARMKEALKEAGMNALDVATRLEISRQTIYRTPSR